jgi:two-component system, cell cycle sensor histidine kinase and response regulator CckA
MLYGPAGVVEKAIEQPELRDNSRLAEDELRESLRRLEKLVEEQDAQLTALNERLKQEAEYRKKLEEKIEQTGQDLAKGVKASELGLWLYNIQTEEVVYSKRLADLLGYDLDELEGNPGFWESHIRPGDETKAIDAFNSMIEGRIPFCEAEYRMRTKSGGWKWILDRGKIVERDAEGRPVRAMGIHWDITEQKQVEEALDKSNYLLKQILSSLNESVFIVDPQSRLVEDCNSYAEKMFDYSREELIGLPTEFLHLTRESFEQFGVEAVAACSSQGFYEAESSMRRKNGEIFISEHFISPLYDDQDGYYKAVSVVRDITQRKQSEGALRESEKKYRLLHEAMRDGFAIVDMNGMIQEFNEVFRTMLGYEPEELRRLSYVDLTPEKWHAFEAGIFEKQILARGYSDIFEKEYRRKDGTIFPAELRGYLIRDNAGNPVGMWAVARDISDRKRADDALRESVDKYRLLFDASPIAILFSDPEGNVLAANRAMQEISGYAEEEMKGLNLRCTYARPEERELLVSALREKGRIRHHEIEAVRRDGTRFWVAVSIDMIDKKDGKFLVSTIIDISERKRAEEALRQSEEKYRLVVENATEAIFISQGGTMKFCNPSFWAMTGYSEEDLVPPSRLWFPDLVPPEEKEMALKNYRKRIKGEKVSANLPYRLITKSGKELHIELNGVRTTWEGKPATLNFVRDVTERKKMEAQLLQAQKMEAVGTLAGGIAHDFNNLLQAIQGFSELLLLDKNVNEPEYRELHEILHAAKRGSELTKRLLTFSRRVDSSPIPVNLNNLMADLQKLWDKTIPKMISIEFQLDADLKTIEADPVQVEQILMNLVVNARDAMPDGGRITIETRNIVPNDMHCNAHLEARPGGYVLLSVTDTGTGMGKETLEHLFEPFYTTKEVGKGTGLGLAIVYGIVNNHGGCITCRSEAGKGTTFYVYLPCTERMEGSSEIGASEKPKGGTETVLLVDDEEMIRGLWKEVLIRFGFRVFTALDGESALDFYRKNREELDLVILDLIMPGMGGVKCLEEILRIDSEAKIIVTSGHYPDGTPLDTLKAGAAGFINKPYQIDDLLKEINRVMNRV